MTNSIETRFVCPPVPTKVFDWQPTFSFFDGDDDQPIGYGETELTAVLSLMQKAAEWDDDGSCIEEIIDLAVAGWKKSK